MTRYKNGSVHVYAEQFLSHNNEEVLEWVQEVNPDAYLAEDRYDRPVLKIPCPIGILRVAEKGDWVVLCEGDFFAYHDEEFRKKFIADPVDIDFDYDRRFPYRCVIQEKADELAGIIRGERPSPDELDSLLHNLYDSIFEMNELGSE